MPSQQPPDDLRELYRSDYVADYHRSAGRRLEQLLPLMHLGTDLTVADFACGNGLLLDVLKGKIGSYCGVDFSQEFIREARRRHVDSEPERAQFFCTSIGDFCKDHPGQIDRAFALDFVEHVYDDELLPILRSIRSCLSPEGRFYAHTPDADFLLEVLKERGIMRQFPEHIAVRDARENAELLTRAGFSSVVVHHLPHYLPVLSWLHSLRGIPLLGRHVRARLFIECRP